MAAIGERRIHAAFEISVVLKGLNALLEAVAGVVLYFTSVDTLHAIVTWLVHDELLEDPRDLVANYLLHAAEQMSVGGKAFAAFYLLSHGAVKLVLVAGLLRDKRWAYPASLAVLGAFIAYQLYRLTFAYSTGLVLLTIFDFIVVALIWHEYSLIRRHLPRT
jgi:uncharacterized membrane protein